MSTSSAPTTSSMTPYYTRQKSRQETASASFASSSSSSSSPSASSSATPTSLFSSSRKQDRLPKPSSSANYRSSLFSSSNKEDPPHTPSLAANHGLSSLFSSSWKEDRHLAASSVALSSSSQKASVDLTNEETDASPSISLHVSSFGAVGDTSWLNSNQLQLACEYLSAHFSNVTVFPPGNRDYLKRLVVSGPFVNTTTKRSLWISNTMNGNGSHWMLFLFEHEVKKCYIVDPLPGMGNLQSMKKSSREVLSAFTITSVNLGLQEDTFNCGIWCLIVAEHLCTHLNDDPMVVMRALPDPSIINQFRMLWNDRVAVTIQSQSLSQSGLMHHPIPVLPNAHSSSSASSSSDSDELLQHQQHQAVHVEKQEQVAEEQQLSKVDQLFSIIPTHQDLKKYYNIWQRLEKRRSRDSPWNSDQERRDRWSLQLRLEYSNQQPPLSYPQLTQYIDNLNTANSIFSRYKRSNNNNEDKAWIKLITKRKKLLDTRIALGHAPSRCDEEE